MLDFRSPLLPVAGRLECWRDWRRLEVMDGSAESCALECVLSARPRAGHGAMTAGHPTEARESMCHEGLSP